MASELFGFTAPISSFAPLNNLSGLFVSHLLRASFS